MRTSRESSRGIHGLVLLMFLGVTCIPFLVSERILPGPFNYAPEILSIAAATYVVGIGVQQGFQFVRPIYWMLFGGLVIGVVCGAILNQPQPGTVFAGLRTYLRALPFFFLGAIAVFNDGQLRRQLLVLLGICFIQLPLAWHQRMATAEVARARGLTATTGDLTYGTLMASGIMSLFLIAAACVLTGLFLRDKIGARQYFPALLLIVLPTALNETKITFVLLPIVLLSVFIVGSRPGRRIRNAVLGALVTAGLLAVFVPVYDHFIQPRWGYGIIDFFMMEGRVEGYLVKGVEVGDQAKAGKLDGIFAAISVVSQDPAKLLFGLGIGNVSESALGRQFSGQYVRLFENFPLSSITYILLELGLLGVALVLSIHCMILADCVTLARRDTGMIGALAAGWAGVGLAILVSLIYSTPIISPGMSYIYWYFSGMIAAARVRVKSASYAPSLRTQLV